MMLSSIRKARVALLAVPLTCALGVAYAGGMEAPSGSMEGYHVVGTLAHGLGYFDVSDVSAQNGWKWISPSVSSTMGLTYNKSGVKWGAHSWDLNGAFNVGYAASNTEFMGDGYRSAVRPDYMFSAASNDFGAFAFSSMVKTTLGEGYVQGNLYSDNRLAEYKVTGGRDAHVYPSMLMLNHYQDTGVKGGSYTTPSLFSLGKGDGLKLFVSARDKNRTSYGASFEVAADNGMAMMLSAGFSPKADFEAAAFGLLLVHYDTFHDGFDEAEEYFEDAWLLDQMHARAQDYLISFKLPAPGMGDFALTGFWNKKDPKISEGFTFDDTPHAYGVSGSFQRDFGPGMTTLRVGYQKDSVRGIAHMAATLGDALSNMTQDRWSVSLNQPVMKNLNALFGWNRYSAKGYPTAPPFGGAGLPVVSATDKVNANALFFVGMEYMIAT